MSVYMVIIGQIPERQPGQPRSEYGTEVAKLVEEYGGEYVVRGGPTAMLEGEWLDRQRLVISRWPDMETAKAFWNSAEYQDRIKPLRAGMGIFDVALFPSEAD